MDYQIAGNLLIGRYFTTEVINPGLVRVGYDSASHGEATEQAAFHLHEDEVVIETPLLTCQIKPRQRLGYNSLKIKVKSADRHYHFGQQSNLLSPSPGFCLLGQYHLHQIVKDNNYYFFVVEDYDSLFRQIADFFKHTSVKVDQGPSYWEYLERYASSLLAGESPLLFDYHNPAYLDDPANIALRQSLLVFPTQGGQTTWDLGQYQSTLPLPLIANDQVDTRVFTIGPDLLFLSPLIGTDNCLNFFLPPGNWLNYQSLEPLTGGRQVRYHLAPGRAPLLVRAGTIIVHSTYRECFLSPSKRIALNIEESGSVLIRGLTSVKTKYQTTTCPQGLIIQVTSPGLVRLSLPTWEDSVKKRRLQVLAGGPFTIAQKEVLTALLDDAKSFRQELSRLPRNLRIGLA